MSKRAFPFRDAPRPCLARSCDVPRRTAKNSRFAARRPSLARKCPRSRLGIPREYRLRDLLEISARSAGIPRGGECEKRTDSYAIFWDLSVKVRKALFSFARRKPTIRWWLPRILFVHRSPNGIRPFFPPQRYVHRTSAWPVSVCARPCRYVYENLYRRLWPVSWQREPRIRKLESNRKLRRALRISSAFLRPLEIPTMVHEKYDRSANLLEAGKLRGLL